MHQEEEQEETKLTPLIQPDAFLNIFEAGNPGTIEDEVIKVQQQHKGTMDKWEEMLPIIQYEGPKAIMWTDQRERLVVPPDDNLKKKILQELHNYWGAGHLGRDKMTRWVHNLPTKQEPYTHHKNPTLQNHGTRERTPVHTDSDGSHHRTPQIERIRCHTDNSQSRMLTRGHLPTLQHHHHRTPDCTIILQTHLPLVWIAN